MAGFTIFYWIVKEDKVRFPYHVRPEDKRFSWFFAGERSGIKLAIFISCNQNAT